MQAEEEFCHVNSTHVTKVETKCQEPRKNKEHREAKPGVQWLGCWLPSDRTKIVGCRQWTGKATGYAQQPRLHYGLRSCQKTVSTVITGLSCSGRNLRRWPGSQELEHWSRVQVTCSLR